MPEAISNQESKLWDAVYGDVKFLVLDYKLRNSWTTKEDAEQAIVQLLQYHGKAQQEYWKFIRALRLMALFGRQLRRSDLPDDVRKLLRRTDKAIFNKSYQPYTAQYWNWQFLAKRQQAKKASNTPYKPWSWSATQAAMKELAADRPNTFKHVLTYLEQQAEDLRPLKPPSIHRVLRYMRDIQFDMETK
jgi:hypothetical protein